MEHWLHVRNVTGRQVTETTHCPPEVSQGLSRERTDHDEGLATKRLELLQGLYINNWPCLFLRKLTVVQLLKFPSFCETKQFMTVFARARDLIQS